MAVDTELLQKHLQGLHADEPDADCSACARRPLILPDGPGLARGNKLSLLTGRTCECGCGETVGVRARFRPGHDAKLKSRLVDAARKGDAEASADLKRLGWDKFI